ncbi:glycolate oxidase subunit GlcE [Sedimentitalea nanhaiensis]|uniref:Glycolate oxidase FAD binding subunit n=1 Tax=Sedimentitalea nanhaiensis TaxID=999627 RepID=A0A1I7DTJ6_9RHOB|nr:glycolate oxidase subunit GlcE [Sedimentitalea nanhaiensis]SFU15031.1 glycolate oxidase FAD binding subunit [Sedimentitalea nanhaiensis]
MKTARDEDELAETVAAACGPLAICGGATRGVDLPGEVLSTGGLRGVALYEPGALTLVVAAGTPVAEIETLLAAQNQQLAFEPMDHRPLLGTTGEPTIGGVVAANLSGPRRIQAGACRDFLLGVRYVDGGGTVIKNGGRVMKNVTGYDLVKLMAGSWGTLGVLTQVSLKVLPRPETQATLRLSGCDMKQAVRAMSAALGSPFEVTAAAFDPGVGEVLVRIEGFADSVSYRGGRLGELLGAFGGAAALVQAAESAAIWQRIRDVAPFAHQPGDVWRLSVRPSDAPAIAQRLNAEALLLDWGGGLIWARVPEGTDLRARAGQFDGHATLVRADAATRARLGMFHPQSPLLEKISAGLRARFDPRGIFNTGLMSSLQTQDA